jgi:hypothetical protein
MSRQPVLDLGELDNEDTAHEPGPPRRSRLRVLVEPGLLVAGVTALVAAQILSSHAPSSTSQQTRPPAHGANTEERHPGLLAPSTARPGQDITIVAYRDRDACGPATLTLDNVAVPRRSTVHATSPDRAWTTTMITFRVPPTMAPGTHEIAWHGPTHCGGHPVKLTATKISIGPASR